MNRRTFIATTAGLGTALLAGCGGGGDEGGSGDDKPSFDGWMEDVGNYDELVDETGSDQVTVAVGAEGNDGNFAFEPAAIEVTTGTTVRWEWTGQGQQHNVVHDDGDFESELVADDGHTFEYTFDSSGTSKYFCSPHQAVGMKGVVVVE